MAKNKDNEVVFVAVDFFKQASVLDKRLLILDFLFNNVIDKDGHVITTQREISEKTGLSTSTVRNFLDKLKKNRIIKQERPGIYKLLDPANDIIKGQMEFANEQLDIREA